jgi:hypothetical protein
MVKRKKLKKVIDKFLVFLYNFIFLSFFLNEESPGRSLEILISRKKNHVGEIPARTFSGKVLQKKRNSFGEIFEEKKDTFLRTFHEKLHWILRLRDHFKDLLIGKFLEIDSSKIFMNF